MLCLLHAEFDKAVYSVGPKGFFSVVVLCFIFFRQNLTGYIISVFACVC